MTLCLNSIPALSKNHGQVSDTQSGVKSLTLIGERERECGLIVVVSVGVVDRNVLRLLPNSHPRPFPPPVLLDSSWVWTEPHSKRLKIRITVKATLSLNDVSIQQRCLLTFIEGNKQVRERRRGN